MATHLVRAEEGMRPAVLLLGPGVAGGAGAWRGCWRTVRGPGVVLPPASAGITSTITTHWISRIARRAQTHWHSDRHFHCCCAPPPPLGPYSQLTGVPFKGTLHADRPNLPSSTIVRGPLVIVKINQSPKRTREMKFYILTGPLWWGGGDTRTNLIATK